MNFSAQMVKAFLRNGRTVSLYTYTGDACPCTTETGRYDPQWHRDNPAPGDEDCNGTTVIDVSETITSVKCFIYSPFASFGKVTAPYKQLMPIGEMTKDDLIYYGGVVASTGVFQSLKNLNNLKDYVLIGSSKYLIDRAFDAGFEANQAEMVLLKKIPS